MRGRIKLINDYFAAAKRTDILLKALSDLELLRPVTIESKLPLGSSAILHGFLTIDEAKLNALKNEDFLRLRQEGLLLAIYAHLLSLSMIERLRRPSQAESGDGERASDEPTPLDRAGAPEGLVN